MLLARPVARLLNISVFVLSMSFREHFHSYFFKRDYYFLPLLHKNHAHFFLFTSRCYSVVVIIDISGGIKMYLINY